MPRYYFDREPIEELSRLFIEWPLLLCSVCHAASLEPHITIEEPANKDNIVEDEFEELLQVGLFHGALVCPRSPCRNKHVVTGAWETLDDDADTAADEDSAEELVPVRNYHVTHVFPPLPLMDFAASVPDTVRDLITSASLVLFSDPSAAANRIRSAIEEILDDKHVRKLQTNSRTKRLVTHDRINLYEAKNSQAASHLMAVKWIGNIGSHEREPLPLGVVLDGLEHFARALELIYDPRERALDKRAVRINQKGRKFRPAKAAKS